MSNGHSEGMGNTFLLSRLILEGFTSIPSFFCLTFKEYLVVKEFVVVVFCFLHIIASLEVSKKVKHLVQGNWAFSWLSQNKPQGD